MPDTPIAGPIFMDVGKLIEKLAQEEEALQKRTFLAPVVRGGNVCVRIQGIICRFHLKNRNFEGWGIFQPESLHEVRLLKVADRSMVRKYLDQLASIELIVAEASGVTRSSVLAHPPGSPIEVDGPIPVHLVERADLFRHIIARFDGFNFWFDRLHPGSNPAQAAFLRRSLDEDLDVGELDRPGLLPQEKRLYAQILKLVRSRREEPDRRRLRLALEHAGALLDRYDKRKKNYSVTFTIEGVRHTSIVSADDLTVLSAGICLSGEDDKFDLQSLVGVLREAHEQVGMD